MMFSMTSNRRVPCVVAAVALVGTAMLVAQEGAQQGAEQGRQQQARPTFRSAARLVELSVVVTDRDGQPVTGLTAGDFAIFDEGKPQTVKFFSIEGGGAPTPAAPAPAVLPQHPREFSNSLADTGGVTIILFDLLNTPSGPKMRARDQIIKFLGQIREDDRVGLYVLTSDGSLRVLHDFTSDARALVLAVSRLRGNISAALAGEVDGARLDRELEEALGPEAGIVKATGTGESGGQAITKHFRGGRAVATIDALDSIGRHLSGVRNRKNLIWVSAAFPLVAFDDRGRSKTGEINRATRALNDANVALYTVDARGLLPAMSGVPGQQTFTTLSMVAGPQDILRSLAEGTGGRAFLNTNDIHGAIRRAADDARLTYVLGYYPTNDVWDGRFHRISVKVSRPGLDVRHRKGYFAVATQEQASAQRSAALQAAVSRPINASGLGLTLRVDPVEGKPSDYRLTVRVEPGAIALEPVGQESHGAIDVVVAQVRADGAEGRSLDHTVNIRASGERLQQFLRDGTTFTHTVNLNPEAERLRIVVRDVRTGALGAIGVSREQLQAIPR
jgi:VWFA-related protein